MIEGLKRYDILDYDPETTDSCIEKESKDGEYVRFEDVKKFIEESREKKNSPSDCCHDIGNAVPIDGYKCKECGYFVFSEKKQLNNKE